MRVNLRAAGTNRFQPRLEVLEDRQVPAFSAWQQGATLFLKGTNSAEYVNIVDEGSNLIQVQRPGMDNVYFGGISRILLDAKGGDDQIEFNMDNDDSSATSPFTLDFKLGSGNDVLNAYFFSNTMTPMSSAAASARKLKFEVDAGSGNDTVLAVFGDDLYSGDEAKFNFDGNSGNDNLNVVFLGNNYGGNVDVHLDGNSGNDTLAGSVGAADNSNNVLNFLSYAVNEGTIDYDLHGGSGKDILSFGFSLPDGYGYMNEGTLSVSMRGQSGDDQIGIENNPNTYLNNSGKVFIGMDGGAGKDWIRLGTSMMTSSVGTSSSGAPLTNTGSIEIAIEGGSNKDTISVETLLAADTTDAYFRLRVKGEGNADNIEVYAYAYNPILGSAKAQVKAGPLDWVRATSNVEVRGARSSHLYYVN